MSQFLSNCPAAMAVLLLTLTTILVVNADQELHGYYKSLGHGYTYAYLRASPAQEFFSTRNLFDCTALAQRSQSQFFTYNKVSRVCKNYAPNNFMTVVSTNDNNEISFIKNSQWIKVYALSMGAGSYVYDSFFNIGSPSTWKVEKCVDTFCPNFFRHPILDFWSHLPIEKVKLVIYKNQTAVVDMVFDGRNTNPGSWFSPGKLISSPWTDLPYHSHNYFSIRGAYNRRRFYVSSNHGGCEHDAGWMCVDESGGCLWEIFPHYPTLFYSNKNSISTWYYGFETADSMAIFIRLKS
ncbi:uncharacterized protein LOC118768485 [Octopus sinensis]|uniref:Uncharacterized protein LOC118768485 n=1 Tax=Octopus sinensis TaxID=2607531 RepID=A0A7E6FTN0_9MOLL|nr:uncharacterized protein LOC118768485 [Octopus sinensis]